MYFWRLYYYRSSTLIYTNNFGGRAFWKPAKLDSISKIVFLYDFKFDIIIPLSVNFVIFMIYCTVSLIENVWLQIVSI